MAEKAVAHGRSSLFSPMAKISFWFQMNHYILGYSSRRHPPWVQIMTGSLQDQPSSSETGLAPQLTHHKVLRSQEGATWCREVDNTYKAHYSATSLYTTSLGLYSYYIQFNYFLCNPTHSKNTGATARHNDRKSPST